MNNGQKKYLKLLEIFMVTAILVFSMGYSLANTQVNDIEPALAPESRFLTGSEQVFYDSCDDADSWIQVESEAEWGGDIFCSTGGLQIYIDLLESSNPSGRFESAYIPYISGPYEHGPMWYRSLETFAQVEQGLEISVDLEQNYISSRMGHVYVALFDQNREAMFVCNVRDSWYGSRVDFRAWYNKLDSEGGGITPINTFTTSLSCSYNIRIWYDMSSDTIKSRIGGQTVNLLYQPSYAEKNRVASEVVISYSRITNYQFQGQRINTISVNAEDILPECNMDVLIAYDNKAIEWYEDKQYTNYEEQMVIDVHHGLHEFYHKIWPSMNFYVSEDWMIYDPDGWNNWYIPPDDDGDGLKDEYYRYWQEELGWNSFDGGKHFGMLNTGEYSGLHGRHFDYLVMFTSGLNLGYGGLNEAGHNAMIENLLGGLPNQWGDNGVAGLWTGIAHESGHGYNLNHDYDCVMDVENDQLGYGMLHLPDSHMFSPADHQYAEQYLTIHDESYWYLKDIWIPEVSVSGMYVEGYSIESGYSVNTIAQPWYMTYHFYGRSANHPRFFPDQYGRIRGNGYFLQDDTFPVYLQAGRRFLLAYAIQFDYQLGEYVIRNTATVLDHNDEAGVFQFRTFCIDSLNPGETYFIACGRLDCWNSQWTLKAEWTSIA
ncbi:MAG: hypothetical protein ACFFE1_15125, partial [Candidatus Thorarchaeota archaeon]